MKKPTITIERYDDEGEHVASIEVGYDFIKADKGCMYGDYPHPATDASADVWPVDPLITLTDEETEYAIAMAVEDHGDRDDEARDRRDEWRREDMRLGA